MRCPKCRYISFGTTERCRNCGYDFSLSDEPAPTADLPMRTDAPVGPLGDLPLAPAEAPATAPAAPDREPGQPPEPAPAPPTPEAPKPERSAPAPSPRKDLPLFARASNAADDAPLVAPPAVPRPPLSVRKPGPSIVRTRPASAGDAQAGTEPASRAGGHGRAGDAPLDARFPSEASLRAAAEKGSVAGLVRRGIAGIIDLALLVAIDAAVIYLTLRVLGLGYAEVGILPPVPLIAFLLLLDGGYLAIFTAAGGQTIGKMSTGIRVVPGAGRGLRVPLGTAVVRAAAYLASLLPLGLGLAPIVLTADRRALHDRLADTRVVQA
jgi:uncharacterized RDD family membrane protein YckC